MSTACGQHWHDLGQGWSVAIATGAASHLDESWRHLTGRLSALYGVDMVRATGLDLMVVFREGRPVAGGAYRLREHVIDDLGALRLLEFRVVKGVRRQFVVDEAALGEVPSADRARFVRQAAIWAVEATGAAALTFLSVDAGAPELQVMHFAETKRIAAGSRWTYLKGAASSVDEYVAERGLVGKHRHRLRKALQSIDSGILGFSVQPIEAIDVGALVPMLEAHTDKYGGGAVDHRTFLDSLSDCARGTILVASLTLENRVVGCMGIGIEPDGVGELSFVGFVRDVSSPLNLYDALSAALIRWMIEERSDVSRLVAGSLSDDAKRRLGAAAQDAETVIVSFDDRLTAMLDATGDEQRNQAKPS